MIKKIIGQCDSCKDDILEGEQYYALSLSREVQEEENIITMLCNCMIRMWCKKCYEELQQLLKTDKAVT